MQFNEIYIGTTFKFCSDTENWWYEKIDDNKVICIESPLNNRYIGEKHIIDQCYYDDVEIRSQKKETSMNLHQIEAKINELKENSKAASKKLSATVNHQNFKVVMKSSSEDININSLISLDIMKILEDRARAEYQAAEKAIEEFVKKFA